MDRRIIRTRTSILHALLDITSGGNDASKIKVVDLCKFAGINKSTFYLHYTDMDDCIEKCTKYIEDRAVMLANQINYEAVANDPSAVVNAICKFIDMNTETIIKLSNSSLYNSIVNRVAEKMIGTICENNNIDKNKHHQYIKISFLVYGAIGASRNSIALNDSNELQKVLANAIKRN